MSQENVELAYRASDCVSRGDLDGFLALMAEDVRLQPQLARARYDGHAGIGRWWTDVVEPTADLTIEVVEVRDLGDDLTLATIRARGQGRSSVIPLDQTYYVPARWRQGECVWWGVFLGEQDAVEAAGLSE